MKKQYKTIIKALDKNHNFITELTIITDGYENPLRKACEIYANKKEYVFFTYKNN